MPPGGSRLVLDSSDHLVVLLSICPRLLLAATLANLVEVSAHSVNVVLEQRVIFNLNLLQRALLNVLQLPVAVYCVVVTKDAVDMGDKAVPHVLLLVLLAGLLTAWSAAVTAVQVSLRAKWDCSMLVAWPFFEVACV
jgi:hypothetical protein